MMKKIIHFVIVAVLLTACSSSDKKGPGQKSAKDSIAAVKMQEVINDTLNYTSIRWLDSTFIYVGNVKEGKQVEVVFRFKNTGDKPLIFSRVEARCGCTVAEKPEEPVAPGEEGVIKGKFDSKGRKGNNRKNIHVEANTKPSRVYELEFEVVVE